MGAAANDLPGCAAGGAREAEVPRGRLPCPGCGPCRLHNLSRGDPAVPRPASRLPQDALSLATPSAAAGSRPR